MKDRFDGVVGQLLDGGIFLEQAIEILEKGMIQGTLERSSGNQCAAARLLGIHRNTLQRKMVEYKLTAPGARVRARRKPAGRAGNPKGKKTGAA
jgi:Fis family transcriptional regulator, factor for inversion stimulation protein